MLHSSLFSSLCKHLAIEDSDLAQMTDSCCYQDFYIEANQVDQEQDFWLTVELSFDSIWEVEAVVAAAVIVIAEVTSIVTFTELARFEQAARHRKKLH